MTKAEYQRNWSNNNRNKTRAYNKKWKKAHPEKSTALQKAWRASKRCKELVYARLLKKIFWTQEMYNKIKTQQKNRCAICGKKVKGNLCGDHDHTQKKPRGLLCTSCNLLLGNAKENLTILKNAMRYLKKWRLR
jgi:hypothetical protein